MLRVIITVPTITKSPSIEMVAFTIIIMQVLCFINIFASVDGA